VESADLHLARVRSRVAMGGHDIPEAKIRERYARSRMKLIELLPHLSELKVFDNTEEGDPQKGQSPSPRLLLHMKWGKIVGSAELSLVPPWAKPILLTGLLRLPGRLDRRLQDVRKLGGAIAVDTFEDSRSGAPEGFEAFP